MKKNDMINNIIKIVVALVVIAIAVILCIKFFGEKDDNKNKKAKVTYVINTENVNILGGNVNTLTNENCDSSKIKNKFSLTLINGAVQVNNLDTMENFLIEKIANASTMIEFNYEKTCDTAMYAILTNDGQVFYTYDDVTKATDVRRIEDKFKLLKTDFRFSELVLGEENGSKDLYGKTSTGHLYKIDLR